MNERQRAAERQLKQAEATSEPGEGARFKAMTALMRAKGADDPEALAAHIGRKKYGPKGMAKMAAAGRQE